MLLDMTAYVVGFIAFQMIGIFPVLVMLDIVSRW